MMKCCGCSPMVGCMMFALLYVLSGVTMATTGIITMLRMPVVFKTGSVIWSGIMATGMGILTMLIVICHRTASLRKNASLLILSVVVLIICSVNLILFEIVEWKEIFGPRLEVMNPQMGDTDGVFVAHLICLVSTVVGLVSSFVGSIYICCMVDPDRGLTKNMDNVASDPEMYKHKYLSTSPPYFSDPSPGGLNRSIQGTGRLDSWTFECPPPPKLGRLVEEEEFTDEEPETVVRIEPSWAPHEPNDGPSEAEPGEGDSLLSGPVIVTVPHRELVREEGGPITVTVPQRGPDESKEGTQNGPEEGYEGPIVVTVPQQEPDEGKKGLQGGSELEDARSVVIGAPQSETEQTGPTAKQQGEAETGDVGSVPETVTEGGPGQGEMGPLMDTGSQRGPGQTQQREAEAEDVGSVPGKVTEGELGKEEMGPLMDSGSQRETRQGDEATMGAGTHDPDEGDKGHVVRSMPQVDLEQGSAGPVPEGGSEQFNEGPVVVTTLQGGPKGDERPKRGERPKVGERPKGGRGIEEMVEEYSALEMISTRL